MKEQKRLATVTNIEVARQKRLRAASTTDAEPRVHSRMQLSHPVRVTLANGMVIETGVSDVFLAGIKLRADTDTGRILYRPGQFINAEDPPNIDISIDLPMPDGDIRIQARCRLTHFNMVSRDEMEFTLHFREFAGAGDAILRHFVRLRANRANASGPAGL